MILIYFLFGIVFYALLLPLLEKIFEWLVCIVQLKISKISVESFKLQNIVDNMSDKDNVNVVGFQVDSEEDIEDDD